MDEAPTPGQLELDETGVRFDAYHSQSGEYGYGNVTFAFDGNGDASFVNHHFNPGGGAYQFGVGHVGEGNMLVEYDVVALQGGEYEIEFVSRTDQYGNPNYYSPSWGTYGGEIYYYTDAITNNEIIFEFDTTNFLHEAFGYSSDELVSVYTQRYDYSLGETIRTPLFQIDIQSEAAQIDEPAPVEPEIGQDNAAIVVTVVDDGSGNKYVVDGVQQDSLSLVELRLMSLIGLSKWSSI